MRLGKIFVFGKGFVTFNERGKTLETETLSSALVHFGSRGFSSCNAFHLTLIIQDVLSCPTKKLKTYLLSMFRLLLNNLIRTTLLSSQ